MAERRVGLLGATSLVGECLLPELVQAGWQVIAFSRRAVNDTTSGVEWCRLRNPLSPLTPLPQGEGKIPYWVCVAPIWILPDYFNALETHGVRRIVVLSSTSRFTKWDSSDTGEQTVARRLANAEACVQAWAEATAVEWVILRPTLIYGRGRDRNIAEIARLIRRYGFFPVLGQASGLRQPVHAEDVARACLAALEVSNARNRAYNISGGETLTYREMVCRVFVALGRSPRTLSVPLSLFRLAIACLRVLPRYRQWLTTMAERMNRDLVFDHAEAARDLGFKPRNFLLAAQDVEG
ncbi:MAG: NAD(P)-dependent oxidoreductase [Pseudomonadota bacterium]